MQPLFSRPQRISSDSLLLVGYRLYPMTSVTLHPRLTVIAGGNGVGKTTLLDALQIILIADQRLLRLNVASGQDDRDIGGQMMGSVAWLVLSIQGHSSIGERAQADEARESAASGSDEQPGTHPGQNPDKGHPPGRGAGRQLSRAAARGLRAMRLAWKNPVDGASGSLHHWGAFGGRSDEDALGLPDTPQQVRAVGQRPVDFD